MLSTSVDGQCGKLVTVIGHQFITLTVDICVQHGGRKALHRAGLSAAAKTRLYMLPVTASQTSFDGYAVLYVLLALWIPSFPHDGTNGPESKTKRMFRPVSQVVTSGAKFANASFGSVATVVATLSYEFWPFRGCI